MVVFIRCFVQVDIYGGVYFLSFTLLSNVVFIFILSSETEAGSAGEQPARVNLMATKMSFKGVLQCAPLIFLEPLCL